MGREMTDTGKQHAIESHQNSDGTFEFVVETLEEPSSVVHESGLEPLEAPPKRSRWIVAKIPGIFVHALGVREW